MKVAIAGVIGNPPMSSFSHNAGWTKTLKNIVEDYCCTEVYVITEKDNWNDYDQILLIEGVNFKGSFNFFGGVQQKQIDRLKKLHEYRGSIRSLSGKLDYNIPIQKRKELKDYDFVFDIPKEINILDLSNKLVLGDSHSISVHKKGYTISRNDGKTLRGFLNKGIKSYLPLNIKDLIFYAGNIDIRFHMFNPNRKGDYKQLCEELVNRLESQLIELNLEKITCVKLIPIEDESRKLPNTGKLDGHNFYGSREDRLKAVLYFNHLLSCMCASNGFSLLEWGFDYKLPLPFEDMEARQSVHLRPSSYMFSEKEVIEDKAVIQQLDFNQVETENKLEPNNKIGLNDFIQYYEKVKKLQEYKYEGVKWTELDINDDLIWNVPIYDIVNRRYAAFSSLLEALKRGENDPKGNGKYFVKTITNKRLTDTNFIKLCYLFRLCGSGINYKPKTSDEPWGTHGFGNFWVVDELRKGLTNFDDWMLTLPEDKFCDVKGYLLPMIKGGLRNFIVKESEALVKHVMEFIVSKQKVGIKDIVDVGNEYLLKLGVKRQNFVLTAFAMDLAEYFPHRVDRNSTTYVGSNAKKCLKKILPGVKTDEALQFLCDKTGNHSKPYDMEDVACDYVRYCENFQSKEHVELNKGIRYERSICK